MPVGAMFSATAQADSGAHPASYTMGSWSFSGGKAAGALRWPPTPSSVEVKGRVELYLYSTSGPSWPVNFSVNFTFILLALEDVL